MEGRGLVLYRLGDWQGSIAALEKTIALQRSESYWEGFILAMAHWQVGDKDRAKAYYVRSAAWLEEGVASNEYLRLRMLRDEAAALLGVMPSPGEVNSKDRPQVEGPGRVNPIE